MEQQRCARLETPSGPAVNLIGGSDCPGDLRGLIFEASVEQRFCNASDKTVLVISTHLRVQNYSSRTQRCFVGASARSA